MHKNLSYYLHYSLPEINLFLTLFVPAHCDSFDNSSNMLNSYHESLTKPSHVLVLPTPEFQSSGI